jgi:hypothetical protein
MDEPKQTDLSAIYETPEISETSDGNFRQTTTDPFNRPAICNRRLEGVNSIIAGLSTVAAIVTAALLVTIFIQGIPNGDDSAIVFSPEEKCSVLGKLILDVGGNVFDSAVGAALCVSIKRPKLAGILGGGLSLFTNMKDAESKSYYTEFLPGMDRSDGRIPIPGNVLGLFDLHQQGGDIKFDELVKEVLRMTKKDEVDSDARKELYEFFEDYQNFGGLAFYNEGGKTMREKMGLTSENTWFAQEDLTYYRDAQINRDCSDAQKSFNKCQHRHRGASQQFHTDEFTVETMIGPTTGVEFLQLLKTAENDLAGEYKNFTPNFLKFADQAHQIHLKDEKDRWVNGNEATYDDQHILEDFMLPKTIKELIKKSEDGVVETGLETACVQTISVMTAGHSLTIMLTMGDSENVKAKNNDETTGIFYPTFTNNSELFQYSASGTASSGKNQWRDIRPIVPFSPVFVRPKCGVCGLQASVGLSTLKANTDTTKLVLPYTTQLQTVLQIKNWKYMKQLVSQALGQEAGEGTDEVRVVGGNNTYEKADFVDLGFLNMKLVERLRTTPVVLAHDENMDEGDPLAGGFVLNDQTELNALFKKEL